ncbi:GntR family transcriptional regulator / MocR family aminotransferase [Enhydrobacter aerosaccus]|uniref:GntR family transcriptional regulator / MocR family aminotransferase n=1 Tax=Enhydrobacter aerosaccus TaxID=225324 RepID=A0A1T4T967_9HYPH|nr:PLP-dependent aminotransferase family protein [Enhydrobacter aerosaccus]SKA37130.1 GntR family transcriptional regulator / MocR family aminotransferase [Enhydrobacter aerosaccus]
MPDARRSLVRPLSRSSLPLQEQLYQRLRDAITEGRLAPGERLPAVRTLASDLGVARGTAESAYARLAGEGYLVPRGPAGTIVSPSLRLEMLRRPTPPKETARPAESDLREPLPFQLGLPALDQFPRTLWARLTARAGRRLSAALLAYQDAMGLPELRQAIASYLAVSRGVRCQPGQVLITGGYQAGLDLIVRLLLTPGDEVWFEEPGYFLARQQLQATGIVLRPIPVDEDGLDVEAGRRLAPAAKLAIVTPAHQSPLGVALSLPRRQALLGWAAETGAWIVEDDYDGEFHYVGRKLPALKSLDSADRVIYAGSFSKTIFPSLRLGYLVLPMALLQGAAAARRRTLHGEPVLGQMVTADFLAEGHFGRHLKRMRTLYAARRQALVRALGDSFGDQLEIATRPGGMQLLARFPTSQDDLVLAHRAASRGFAATALSSQYLGRKREHGLLLGFTNIPEQQALAIAHALRQAVSDLLPRP